MWTSRGSNRIRDVSARREPADHWEYWVTRCRRKVTLPAAESEPAGAAGFLRCAVRLAFVPSQLGDLFVSDASEGFFGLIETASQSGLLCFNDAVETDITIAAAA